MSVLPIYLYGTQVLREVATPVKSIDTSMVKLIVDMFETMKRANGIGLAATQVGELKRIVVVDISEVEEEPFLLAEKDVQQAREDSDGVPDSENHSPKKMVLINPEVVEEEGSWIMEEGCLSIPDARADVSRAESIVVKYFDSNLNKQELQADGLLARVILHEIDHLNGKLFIDRISPTQRALIKNRLREIKNGEIETSYPVVTFAEV